MTAINDSGQIVGRGNNVHGQVGFVMSPVPLPSPLLLAAALTALGVRAGWRRA